MMASQPRLLALLAFLITCMGMAAADGTVRLLRRDAFIIPRLDPLLGSGTSAPPRALRHARKEDIVNREKRSQLQYKRAGSTPM